MIDGVSNTLEFFILCATAATLGFGWVKKIRPWRQARAEAEAGKERDRIAQRDVLIGRPPIYDTTVPDKILVPALPGIGQRMDEREMASAEQARQLAEMARALTTLAESNKHQLVQDKRLDDHASRLDKLEEAAVERVVSRAESAAAWRAMEAAAKALPDETTETP